MVTKKRTGGTAAGDAALDALANRVARDVARSPMQATADDLERAD